MLKRLSLTNLGPAPRLDFDFAERLNIITGDNGVGKTFVLDIAWWALTRTWADGKKIHPNLKTSPTGEMSYVLRGKTSDDFSGKRTYDADELDWAPLGAGPPPKPGLVIYARIDGGFSLWDPNINHSRKPTEKYPLGTERPSSFQFPKRNLWEGLYDENNAPLCRGLLEDWATWQLKGNGVFAQLKAVLAALSPAVGDHILEPGEPMRTPESKAREVPTLRMSYGLVPVTHASAAVRRIISLAYMLVWAWQEHQAAAKERGRETTPQIILLWDEVEAHLHPQWQRVILPAVAKVLETGLSTESVSLQIIATTHAPLVLASLEPLFDEDRDQLFNLELGADGVVTLIDRPWAMQGDAASWLMSASFGLTQARSKEAQVAMEAAKAYMRGDLAALVSPLNTPEAIDQELRRVLASSDKFWPRWIIKSGQHNAEAGL
jgi:hypothetical protein